MIRLNDRKMKSAKRIFIKFELFFCVLTEQKRKKKNNTDRVINGEFGEKNGIRNLIELIHQSKRSFME